MQFFVFPEDTLQPLLDALAMAERRLDIYIFKLENDTVEAALCDAARRGVEVRAILDNNADTATAAYRRLEAAAISVRWPPPYFVKTHAKSFVADGRHAWISTLNFASGWQHTRDYAILSDDLTIIAAFNGCFLADWEQQPSRPSPTDVTALVVSPINSRATLLDYIATAQRSLLVQHEQFDDPQIIAALADRANAGVQVQMVMGAERSSDAVRQLQQAAPHIQAVFPDKQKLNIHAKLIIRDAADMLLGSLNLTSESLDRRREISLVVNDPLAVQRAITTFQQDFAAYREK